MKRPTLYQLQASWDDDRAHRRIADLRRQLAPQLHADRRWAPLVFAGALILAVAAAALSRALPA